MTSRNPNLYLSRVEGNPPAPTESDLENIADVYANAFAGPPWNEYTRCLAEGKFYGKNTEIGALCECGQEELVAAYPRPKTEKYIAQELARPDSSLFLLKDEEERLAGFTWGFSYENPEQFALEKYQTEEMQERVIRVLGRSGITEAFYYLSESAIDDDPTLRGRGISLQFHKARLEVAEEKGLPAVQRTSADGPMYRTSLKAGMAQIMGPETIVDTAARTFTRTGVIVNGELDTEIASRVLFVK